MGLNRQPRFGHFQARVLQFLGADLHDRQVAPGFPLESGNRRHRFDRLGTRCRRAYRPRGWLAVGAVAGVGLLDKHLIAFLLGALAVGVAATPAVRHYLRSWWTWAGVGARQARQAITEFSK